MSATGHIASATMSTVAIDDAIDQFCGAIEAAGVAPPRSPDDTAVLDKIEVGVAPLGVPRELRRVWERLDPSTVRYRTQPELTSPGFALQAWQGHEREPGQVPRVLFPLAYESWQFAFVELHGPQDQSGGTVFQWQYGGSDFFLTHDSVEDWFRAQTDALTNGSVTRAHGYVRTEYVEPARAAAALLERRGPHPVYETATALPEATTRWPRHWLTR